MLRLMGILLKEPLGEEGQGTLLAPHISKIKRAEDFPHVGTTKLWEHVRTPLKVFILGYIGISKNLKKNH